MPLKNKETPTDDLALRRMRRKRDQAWDLAGLARMDGDSKEELRYTEEAKNWQVKIREYQAS